LALLIQDPEEGYDDDDDVVPRTLTKSMFLYHSVVLKRDWILM
jgi:hypothetical protein